MKMKRKIIKNRNIKAALMISCASISLSSSYASQDRNMSGFETDTNIQRSESIEVPIPVPLELPSFAPIPIPIPRFDVYSPISIRVHINWIPHIIGNQLIMIPTIGNGRELPETINENNGIVVPNSPDALHDTTQPVPSLIPLANIDRSIHNHGGARNDELLRPENIRSLRNVTHLTYENLNNGGGSRLIELINNGSFPELTTLTLHGHLYHTLDNLNLNSVGRLRQLELHGHELSNSRQQELRARLPRVEIIF